jgi:hypothetical protein
MQNRPLGYARVSTTGQTLEAQLDELSPGPFVERITFHEPVRQQAQGEQDQPPRGGKPTIVK